MRALLLREDIKVSKNLSTSSSGESVWTLSFSPGTVTKGIWAEFTNLCVVLPFTLVPACAVQHRSTLHFIISPGLSLTAQNHAAHLLTHTASLLFPES